MDQLVYMYVDCRLVQPRLVPGATALGHRPNVWTTPPPPPQTKIEPFSLDCHTGVFGAVLNSRYSCPLQMYSTCMYTQHCTHIVCKRTVKSGKHFFYPTQKCQKSFGFTNLKATTLRLIFCSCSHLGKIKQCVQRQKY